MFCTISKIYRAEINFENMVCKLNVLQYDIVNLTHEIKTSAFIKLYANFYNSTMYGSLVLEVFVWSINYFFLVCKLHISHVTTIKFHSLFQNLIFSCWCKFHRCSTSKIWDISHGHFLPPSIYLWTKKGHAK